MINLVVFSAVSALDIQLQNRNTNWPVLSLRLSQDFTQAGNLAMYVLAVMSSFFLSHWCVRYLLRFHRNSSTPPLNVRGMHQVVVYSFLVQ